MTKPDSGRPLEDLVICADHNYSFDNRWAFTGDLVDYRTVEPWDGTQLHRKHSALKRLKVHGRLPGKPMADLLKLVSTKSRLEHLEIDTLELHCDLPNEYHFNFLKRLSINEIRIVDRFGLEVKRSTRTIRLIDSPPDGALNRIKHLYLGKFLSHVSLMSLMSLMGLFHILLLCLSLPSPSHVSLSFIKRKICIFRSPSSPIANQQPNS